MTYLLVIDGKCHCQAKERAILAGIGRNLHILAVFYRGGWNPIGAAAGQA
jgi:hypothetical protein